MSYKEQAEKLREQIERHEYNFLILGQKTISDFELESLRIELDRIERKVDRENTGTHIQAVAH